MNPHPTPSATRPDPAHHAVAALLAAVALVGLTGPSAHSAATSPLDHWQAHTPTVQFSLSALTWNAESRMFVAVDEPAPGSIPSAVSTLLTSPNGATWQRLPAANTLLGTGNLAAGNGRYQAVTFSAYPNPVGSLAESTDGVTWSIPSAPSRIIKSVAYQNQQFVAVGWIPPEISICDPLNPCPNPSIVAWFNGHEQLLEVPRLNNLPDSALSVLRADVAHGGNTWVIMAWVGWATFGPNPFSSTPQLHAWASVNNGPFLRSPMLRSYPDASPSYPDKFRVRVRYGQGRFVAVSGDHRILASPDGLQWQATIPEPVAALNDVAFGDGQFVAVGRSGHQIASPDGSQWTHHPLSADVDFRAIEHGDHRFVALTGTNTVHVSSPLVSLRISPPLPTAPPRIDIAAPLGTHCQIEIANSPAPAQPESWTPIETVVTTQDPHPWTDPNPAPQQRFYRVTLLDR